MGEHDRYTRRERSSTNGTSGDSLYAEGTKGGGGEEDNRGLVVVEVEGGETPTPPISLEEQWGAEPTILTN